MRWRGNIELGFLYIYILEISIRVKLWIGGYPKRASPIIQFLIKGLSNTKKSESQLQEYLNEKFYSFENLYLIIS